MPERLTPDKPELDQCNPERLRILAVAAHPVQYQAPLFRRLAAREDVELQVAYCSLRGAEAGHDPEFGTTVQWDVPLLEGYSWTHVRNRGKSPADEIEIVLARDFSKPQGFILSS